MLAQIEGSQAVARTVALCRPEVVATYPISPQTHIIEHLGRLVRAGELGSCQCINADSEFSALSLLIGASAAGARTYTATSSQGLLYMTEAVFNAAGLGLPIVMTLANRAVGAPINIWNDQSDAMALRDAGWIQLFAGSNQEAIDLHVLAFALAEDLSIPVMVCMDGYVLTHAVERLDLPSQDQVDELVPPFEPRQLLCCEQPHSIGAMVGPDAFTEVRYLAHLQMRRALKVIPRLAQRTGEVLHRDPVGLLDSYRLENAETVVVAMGSILGTVKDVVDDFRREDVPVGVVGVRCFRPFPDDALRSALEGARTVVVIERAVAAGVGGALTSDLALSLYDSSARIHTVVAGLGGRAVRASSLRPLIGQAHAGSLSRTVFCDLKHDVVDAELERMAGERRHGPVAEAVLRRQGFVAPHGR